MQANAHVAREVHRLGYGAGMQTLRSWQAKVFIATWLAYAAYYFSRKPFFVAKALLEETYGWDTATLGALGAVYLVTYTIGQFLAGGIGTARGPRALLVGGMFATAMANLALGWANTTGTFALFMGINGLAQATGWAGGVGTMAAWFKREQRGTIMGFWATNFQVGGVLATGAAAFMLDAYGLQYAFMAGSWVTLMAWGVVLLWQRDTPEAVGHSLHAEDSSTGEVGGGEPEEDERWTSRLIINIGLIGLFYFFVKFIRYALWSWAPYLLSTEYGLDIDDAGYLSVVFDAAGIAGVIVAGVLSDRLFNGRRTTVSVLFLIAMVASCALLASLGRSELLWFGISLGLIGFSLYGPDALMSGAGAMDVGSRRQAVAAAGIINGMGSCGAVVQEFVLGTVLKSTGSETVFLILLASAMFAVLCLLGLLLRNRMGLADV